MVMNVRKYLKPYLSVQMDPLDQIIQEADSQADVHNCFIEVDVQALDGSDKSWY